MKHIIVVFILYAFVPGFISAQEEEVLFYEGFESGTRPSGWTEEVVREPAEYFRYRNGGHNPNDPNNLVPPGEIDNGRNPDRAYSGTYNAYFQKESTSNETTRVITPPIDLTWAIKPELRFWHAQVPWVWGGQSNHDILRIYYRKGANSDWVLLEEFLDPVDDWTQHIIPLPEPGPGYYIAFEASTRWGHGVVLDDVEVVETGIVQRYVQSLDITRASEDYVVAGTDNNEVLRLRFRVFGNSGNLTLNSLEVTSLNTSDSDIAPQGVRLYSTRSATFSTARQVGTAAGFSGGRALIDNIGHILPTGESFIWITYDLDAAALHGNLINGMLEALSLSVGDTLLPAAPASPPGHRKILETVFHDNFDVEKGWQLTGEFEIAEPAGGGGNPGNPNPTAAYSGTRVLGTDLTGRGNNPFNYEPGISDTSQHYHAVSPPLDLFFYKDVLLRFRQWLNVEIWDGAYIEISTDGKQTWQQVWRNSNFVLDNDWIQKSFDISGMADRKEDVHIRFGLGETDDFHNYSGWNIDNFILTGEYITRDMSVTGWLGDNERCGMTAGEPVTIVVSNLAAIPNEHPVPVAFSVNGGATWTEELITETIPVGGSIEYTFNASADFSQPGLYDVRVRTGYPGDQEPENDELRTTVLSIPVHELPHHEDFEGSSAIFWRPGGTNSSWAHGAPSGSVIGSAAEGSQAWVTNLSGEYNEDEASYVEGPCFDLRGNDYPVFEMKSRWHTASGDHAAVLYSVDDGATWHRMGNQGDGDGYSWNWYNTPEGWSGDSEGWVISRHLMGPELVNTDNVCFRVAFTSGSGEKQNEGFAFDGVRIYNIPADAGVTGISYPVDGCAYTLPVRPLIGIRNFGVEAIEAGTEMKVGFDIDGNNLLMETFLLENDILPGESLEYRFSNNIDLSSAGTYRMTAYTLLEGDIDFYNEGHTNDTTVKMLMITSIPLVDLGRDIYTVRPDTVMLEAFAGQEGNSYLWQDGTTQSWFDVPEEGLYKVTVTDPAGCYAIDSVQVIRLIADIGVHGVSAPVSSCELGSQELITVRVHNYGTDTLRIGRQFTMHLSFNGEEFAETATIAEELLPGAEMPYTFIQSFDLSEPGSYNVAVSAELEYDNDPSNDLYTAVIQVHGYPHLDLGPDVILAEWEYTIDAGGDYVSWLWHDGSSEPFFVVREIGINEVSLTVTDANNCSTLDEMTVTLEIRDMAVDSILSPESSCGLPDEVLVSARFSNTGSMTLEAGTTLEAGYTVNHGAAVVEELVLEQDLPPGEGFDYIFPGSFAAEEGNWYTFTVYISLDGDMLQQNDTMSADIGIFEPPVLDLGPDVIIQALSHTIDPGGSWEAFLWHDGSTGTTFTVTERGITNASLTVTDSNGCQSTDTKQVMLLVPDVGVSGILLPGAVCPEEPEILRIAVTNYGNTNISASAVIDVSYRIGEGEAVVERLQLPGTLGAGNTVYHEFGEPLSLAVPGEHTIEAWTIYGSDLVRENDSTSTLLEVHQSPLPDIGNGSEQIFTLVPIVLDAGEEFESYLWQDGSTGRILEIPLPVEDWFTVTVTDGNNCTATSSVRVHFPESELAMMHVEVPENACELSGGETISVRVGNVGEYPVPEGNSIELFYSINDHDAVREVLTLSGDLAAGGSVTHTFSTKADFSAAGTYAIDVWLEFEKDGDAANNSMSDTTKVYGNPVVLLAAGADTLYASLPVTLNAGEGFASYLWQDGSTGSSLVATSFGEYQVVVTDVNGCGGTGTVVVESPLSVPAIPVPEREIRIYPNPASERLFVRSGDPPANERTVVELINLAGVSVYRSRDYAGEALELEIDVSGLPPGTYILRITNGNNRMVRAVIIN